MVQRHGAPHHVVGPIEPVCRQVCPYSAQSVTEPGRVDPLLCDLHHSGGGVGHDDGADQVGEQDAQPAGATANVNSLHPRAEVHGLLDGPGHRHLALLVAGVVVPRCCLVVESLVFVHVLDPSPALPAEIVDRGSSRGGADTRRDAPSRSSGSRHVSAVGDVSAPAE